MKRWYLSKNNYVLYVFRMIYDVNEIDEKGFVVWDERWDTYFFS